MKTSKMQSMLFLTTLFLVTILFLYLLKPFFFPIFWAAVIAGVFRPLFKRVNLRLKRPSVSSAIVLAAVVLIIILPGAVIASLLFNESVQIYNSIGPNNADIEKKITGIMGYVKSNPLFASLHIDEDILTEKFADIARGISNFVFINLKALTQNSIAFIIQFAVMLYTLYFFIRDGEKFLKDAINFFSLGNNRERILYERFITTARSTLKVTLIIGGIQGLLGGLLFWLTGVDGALLWGVVMVIAAIVPVIGCSIIWGPAGIFMLLTGYIWEGLVILASGVLIIGTVDNFLRPVLLGRDTQMHPLLIFLSTLGGISLFGFSGFVIGPIITSLLLAMWTMYDQFYRDASS
jgi:predicted PurR-regulated permease PerM